MIVQVGPEPVGACLGNRLAFMQQSGEMCDFTILVSGSEIKAHRCVLAVSCDYFKASFSFGELSQSVAQVDLTHIGCDVKAVETVIQSFYTNEIDLEPSCLEGILQLVDYLMYDRLKRCIETYMESTLAVSTAVSYFQLALRYMLHSSGLVNDIKWLLYFRFHDCFIYQQETLEAGVDLISAFVAYNIFRRCSPLQIVEFILKNLKIALERLHNSTFETNTDLEKEIQERLVITFGKLIELFNSIRPELLEKWKPRLVRFMKAWRKTNLSPDGDRLTELFWYVQAFEIFLSDHVTEIDCVCLKNDTYHTCHEKLLRANCFKKTLVRVKDSFEMIVCRSTTCDVKGKEQILLPGSDAYQSVMANSENGVMDSKIKWKLCACASGKLKEPVNLQDNNPGSKTRIPVAKSELLDLKRSLTNENKQTLSVVTETVVRNSRVVREVSYTENKASLSERVPKVLSPSHCASFQENECNILVVLAPTADMAAQLLATDDDTYRPLIRAPQLELCYYDIEFHTWCRGCKLSLPFSGAMLEKHSWRIAFLSNCLYMLSLSQEVGVQYNVLTGKWVHLDCKNIFSPHDGTSPVKSVIPIKVGKKLIVLSLSRESQPGGRYSTKQHYFEMQDDCRKFALVASVKDDQQDMPIAQCTVSGQTLITVKAGTMLNGTISHIQHIHVYNAETKELKTHEADCTMESAVKILVKDHIVYILNNDGWSRLYDLKTSDFASMKRYPSMVKSSTVTHSDEYSYPAMTHLSCHAGSSRWEVSSGRDSISSRMMEMLVTDDGNIDLRNHPSPPFQFMTALCPSTMSRTQLDVMEQPRFALVENLTLDFSYAKTKM